MRPSYDQLEASCRILADENERLRWVVERALDQLTSGKHYDAEETLQAALSDSSGKP